MGPARLMDEMDKLREKMIEEIEKLEDGTLPHWLWGRVPSSNTLQLYYMLYYMLPSIESLIIVRIVVSSKLINCIGRLSNVRHCSLVVPIGSRLGRNRL